MNVKRKFVNLEAMPPAPDAQAAGEIVFVASTSNPDRVGDRVVVEGISLENYAKNPIVLFGHDHDEPVGTGRVWVENGALKMAPTFSMATETSRDVAAQVADKTLRAVSIGFIPLETVPNEFGGFDIVKSELLEVSVVAVPMNPEAIREKAIDPEMATRLDAIDAKLDSIISAIAAMSAVEPQESSAEPVDQVKAFFAALTTQSKEK